jgi:DNA replication and repair protein RecF
MRVERLEVVQFRNHARTTIAFGQGINALVGENGQGKTNILEAISYLSLSKSFYASTDVQAVMVGKEFFEITAQMVDDGGQRADIRVVFHALTGDKTVAVNGAALDRVSAVVGLFPAVILSPDHGRIIAGAPAERRKFLDIVLSQTSSSYFADVLEYRRILRQRNRLLADARLHGRGISDAAEPWTAALIERGSRIVFRRAVFLERLQQALHPAYEDLVGADDDLTLVYLTLDGVVKPESPATVAAAMTVALERCRQEEGRRGATLVGPHRDDVTFLLRNLEAHAYASQGEQKTLLIALKLAEYQYVCETRGERPILLLDDVFAELDRRRAGRVLEHLTSLGQALITTTDGKLFAPAITWNDHHRRFSIERGCCTAGQT